MSEGEKVHAPFTTDQCDSMNGYQVSGVMHPFTCQEHSNTCLIATRHGWYCPYRPCSYTQEWAWRWMADWTWKDLKRQQEEMGFKLGGD